MTVAAERNPQGAARGAGATADKTLFVKTFGCQMNVYDSERMAETLAVLGYRTVDAPDDADMVIVNTCHIREKATEKVFSDLGRLRVVRERRRRRGADMILAVAGCVAQAEGAEILRRAPYVDIVLGPQTYHRLPEMVARAARAGGRVLETDFPLEVKFDHLPERARAAGVSAFLSVQEGCDRFCTFCVVPYTRGAEYSRPVADLVAEAERLAETGARELVLLGQNVNAYHGAGADGAPWSLARLVRRLARVPGIARLRYTTSHPRDMSADLIDAHGEVGELMPYLHLPVQSGSDRVLAAMNRGYDGAGYRHLVARLRSRCPDIALSSDFIVGFPGETRSDFEATLELVRAVGFAQAFSFRYSPRPGTPAAALAGQVDAGEGADRLSELQELLRDQQNLFNRASVGRTLPVLVEGAGRHPGQLAGRSPYLQAVHMTGAKVPAGAVTEVHITAAGINSLTGRVAARGAAA